MPSKQLRSLLLELFPFEMRVELDLLSRQRGIENDMMQAKLFEILQKYGLDAVQLGMGTNRYGFRINSFVVKFATNDEGRIDNLKEFKMATRLQPDVVRVFEVAENGSLLVCEYVQPFETFSEMLKYEDDIKEILKKLSAVYLIGDVGISEINYGNWGLRVGDPKPVCLDFAYIYDISSELFLCTAPGCHGGAMLIPTANYSQLICPKCNKLYNFEHLRIRVSSEAQLAEIGDITSEGYALTEVGHDVQLDEERSPYLFNKRPKLKKVNQEKMQEVPKVDTFVALPGYQPN